MKIAVLVSGGVDSSVALALLKQQGHDVTAFYLKIWLEDELSFLGTCPWEEDLEYARAVCKKLDVPLEIVPLQSEYKDRVISYTIDEVTHGRTPNPDMLCNTFVKFGAFYEAVGNKFDKIATGHYARICERNGFNLLKLTPDQIKDQTYFLARLTDDQRARVLFPLGAYEKAEIRKFAQTFDLPTKDRKDSQGLCFLGKISFKEFIKQHAGTKVGDIVELETGKILAQHEGFWFYTIGQRQGIGLSGGPWYVAQKDAQQNIVYISKEYFSEDKKRDQFYVTNCLWFENKIPKTAQVKLRHGAKLYDCLICTDDNKTLVKLSARDQGLAAGQFAVFYDVDGYCIGSGTISL